MSALATLSLARKICLTAFFLMARHFGWLRQGLADLAHETPLWVAVSIMIFLAASLSSTVGFAFSAIATRTRS